MNSSVLAGQKAPSVALSVCQRSSRDFVCVGFVGETERDQEQSPDACMCAHTYIFMCGMYPCKYKKNGPYAQKVSDCYCECVCYLQIVRTILLSEDICGLRLCFKVAVRHVVVIVKCRSLEIYSIK